jgi:S-DNA-T family DNA segregation ATPase FtsK/SpoIIIE
MAKRRSRSKTKPSPTLSQFMRGELIGSVLVLVALLMLLSLLSPIKGQITSALIDGLRSLFGVGVWAVPFLLGGLGVWLALRDVTEGNTMSPWRLVGALGLFLVFEGFATLVAGIPASAEAAAEGAGGGLLGWLICQGLGAVLGVPITVAVLLILAAISLLALSGKTLAEVSNKLADAWRGVRDASRGPDGNTINPRLPLGQERFWRRWWRRLTAPRTREPARPPLVSSNWIGAQPATRTATPAVRAASGPASAAQPRIVGGQAWQLPVLSEILEDSSEQDIQQEDIRKRMQTIENTLAGFGVPVSVVEVNQGPAVTQFGLRPGTIVRRDRKGEETVIKVRVSQIQALTNDLSLALAASPIRIEAPVPGRDFVGIEVPNMQISMVSLRGVMDSEEWAATKGTLIFGLGRDVSGQATVADMVRMPHLLIAGATGSGKSVCVNAIITSLLLTHTPDTLRFLMIDPKRVELTVYNGIPHLIAPVVVDVERALPVLQWATREMERRYKQFSKLSARNIESYNEKLVARGEPVLPYIVILIDELADLMLSAPEDVEKSICRIAQMARATGIHLVLATQRPSVDVVTGLIKANFPARIAFSVTSQVDSRVILDTPGAEQLLGRGDMLFMAPDASKLQRLQGCFVSDHEAHRLVEYWRGASAVTSPPDLLATDEGQAETALPEAEIGTTSSSAYDGNTLEPPWLPGQETLQQPLWDEIAAAEAAAAADNKDDMYLQAVEEVRKSGKASISLLQRKLRIGYSRAARLIDQMEADGIVGPEMSGSRGREVLPASPAGEN